MYCPNCLMHRMLVTSNRNGLRWYECSMCGTVRAREIKLTEDKTPRIKQASEYIIKKVAKKWLT